MLVRKLIETLKSTKYPDACVYLHSGINKEAATGVIFKNNAVVLQSGREDHKLKTSWLIDLLKDTNPEARVYFEDGEEILVVQTYFEDRICLRGDSDSNAAACQLDVLFRNAVSLNKEFYLDLLETGFDANMVRKHMGNDCADNMIKCCKENGLPTLIVHGNEPNKDYNRRDQIIFGEDYNPEEYVCGHRYFYHIPFEKIKKLIDEKFVNIDHSVAYPAQLYSLLEYGEKHKNVSYSGCAFSPEDGKYRTVINEIYHNFCDEDIDAVIDFINTFCKVKGNRFNISKISGGASWDIPDVNL